MVCYFVFHVYLLFSCLIVQVNAQICRGMSQYDRCSTNSACGCFQMAGANNIGVCGFLWSFCSRLMPCGSLLNDCSEPDHICVHHIRCGDYPVCYPLSMIDEDICPLIPTSK